MHPHWVTQLISPSPTAPPTEDAHPQLSERTSRLPVTQAQLTGRSDQRCISEWSTEVVSVGPPLKDSEACRI